MTTNSQRLKLRSLKLPVGVLLLLGIFLLSVRQEAYGQLDTNTALGGAYANPFNVTAMPNPPTGDNNSAFGNEALSLNVAASDNSAFGANALGSNLEGAGNNAFGSNALENNTNGSGNNAFGFNALLNNGAAGSFDASDNNAFGNSALQDNRTGNSNTAVGESALRLNVEGSENVAVGKNSLRNNAGGNNNVAVGQLALTNNTTGDQNTSIGDNSNNFALSLTPNPNQTTALGADTLASANTATALGYAANAIHAGSTAIGTGATTTRANQVMVGTVSDTYTMPGITSAASSAAQSGPTQFVTTDANGNLASDNGATSIIINKNTAGIAGAFALSGIPEVLPNGTNYAVAANWGTFGGANAAALGGVARVDGDLFFNAATVLGYAPGVRAGLAYCW